MYAVAKEACSTVEGIAGGEAATQNSESLVGAGCGGERDHSGPSNSPHHHHLDTDELMAAQHNNIERETPRKIGDDVGGAIRSIVASALGGDAGKFRTMATWSTLSMYLNYFYFLLPLTHIPALLLFVCRCPQLLRLPSHRFGNSSFRQQPATNSASTPLLLPSQMTPPFLPTAPFGFTRDPSEQTIPPFPPEPCFRTESQDRKRNST